MPILWFIQTLLIMPDYNTRSDFQNVAGDPPHAKGQIGTTHSNVEGKMRNSVRALLGDSVRLSEQLSLGDLDVHTGVNHSTTGIPYAIHGTAKVVNTKVATWLAGFDDPIKAIMPVGVHEGQKIIIKRKYVVGGSAVITPERAPAKTVSIREDEREVLLTRYGGDLEMNLNLFLRPNDAREELDMKLDAQRQELENVMIQIGYETILREGINLMEALARANPAMAHMKPIDRQFAMEKTYVSSIFGCINKHPYPVENLLAAAAKANLYTPTGARRDSMSVMIVPPGMMDITKYTRESDMKFSVSGLSKDRHGKINMPLSNVLEDKTSNLRILVHVPPPSFRNGAAFPQVETNGLMNVASWATFYPIKFGVKTRITDFKNRCWSEVDMTSMDQYTTAKFNSSYEKCVTNYKASNKVQINDKGEVVDATTADPSDREIEAILVRPRFSAMMQSAILCTKPSSQSGELLMAYPQTGVSTSQTTESMKMQLRVYLGAVLYQPENYIVLPDVAFSGAVGGHGANVCTTKDYNPEEHDLILAFKTKGYSKGSLLDDPVFRATAGEIFYQDYIQDSKGNSTFGTDMSKTDEPTSMGSDGEGVPLVFHQGRTECYNDKSNTWSTATRNLGHLGQLDDPELSDRIEGMQKYQVVAPEGTY